MINDCFLGLTLIKVVSIYEITTNVHYIYIYPRVYIHVLSDGGYV